MKFFQTQEKKVQSISIIIALCLVGATFPLTSDAELTDYNANESDYSIKSCPNPTITEDRPNEQSADPEDPSDLAEVNGNGVDFQLEDNAQGARAAIQNPLVRPHLFPEAPRQGELLDILAEQRFFKTNLTDIYTSWCVNGITQQGIVAGGEKIEETVPKFPDKAPGSPGPCCNAATRTPPADADKDGMDDEWESFHFLDKTIDGVTYTSIDQVKPDDDPDNDGYCATDFRKIDAPRGTPVTITPSAVTAPRTKSDGTQEQVGYATGDCSFPNAEEFIWGTDPTNSDTDADGYTDEGDLAGKGQKDFSYTSEKKTLQRDELRVTSAGMSQKGLIKIDSYARDVLIGKGDPLEVTLTPNEQVPRLSVDLEVTATVQNTDKLPQALQYTWEVDGVKVDDAKNGFGKNVLTIDKNSLAADKKNINIAVHVIEKLTAELTKEADKNVDISFGDTFDLVYTPNCADNGFGDMSCPVQGSKMTFMADINTFRGPHFNTATLDQKKALLDQSELRWYVDNAFITAGRGIDAARLDFTPTKIAGQTHKVLLQILGRDKIEYASGSIDILVYGPSVVFSTSPALSAKNEIIVRPGTTVSIGASPKDFKPQNNEFSFRWNIDSALLENEQVIQTENSISFTPTRQSPTYTIRMSIKGTQSGPQTEGIRTATEQATGTIRIRVQGPSASAVQAQSLPEQARSLFAGAFTFVKEFFNRSFSSLAKR